MRQLSRNSYKDYEYEMRAAKLTIQTPPVIRTLYPEDGPNRGWQAQDAMPPKVMKRPEKQERDI